jgi:hypothetical protein
MGTIEYDEHLFSYPRSVKLSFNSTYAFKLIYISADFTEDIIILVSSLFRQFDNCLWAFVLKQKIKIISDI